MAKAWEDLLVFGMYSVGVGGGVEQGALFGEAERGEMTCCQSELTVTAQCFSAS